MIFQSGESDGKNFWKNSNVPNLEQNDIQENEVLISNFYKKGKAFGQKCLRQYYLYKQFLLYSDVGNFDHIKGFVRLDGVYAQFKRLEHQFEIYLRNNGYQIILLTDDGAQFFNWSQALSSRCILTTFDTDFILGANIGNGNFSSVYRCQNQLGEEFAVKIITKQTAQLKKKKNEYEEQLLSEIATLRQLNHDSILKLYRVYENADKIFLITEFINGSELISFPSSKITFTSNDLKGFIYNMLLVLNELQKHNIMHRDIKPQNIMLRNNKLSNPCLVDFGLAVDYSKKNFPFPSCGSPGYSAPEIIRYEDTKKTYGAQCDMFSFGVTLFGILYGYNPFKCQDKKTTIKKNGDAYFEIPNSMYPKQLEILIQEMTKKYPKDRITVSQALNHQLFQTPFIHMIQLPKTILTKQQYDMMQNNETSVNVHASLEMDFLFGFNTIISNSPNQKDRFSTINSNPMRRTSVILDQIDEFQLDSFEDTIESSHLEKLKLNQVVFHVSGKHKTSINSTI